MRHSIASSALLVALFFPATADSHHTCSPPAHMDGHDARHDAQLALAEEYHLPFFETATRIRELVEEGGEQFMDVPNKGIGFETRGIGIHPVGEHPPLGCKHYPKSLHTRLYYVRTETAAYLFELGRDFAEAFPSRFFEVTSLARTAAGQRMLHACGATSKQFSPHQWGITFDVAWRGLSVEERCWLVERLERDQDAGYVIVVDETTYGKHLHVTVIPDWLQKRSERQYPLSDLVITEPND